MPTPSLLIVPARFKSGKLYSQIPTSGAGDFTVTRATAATRVNASGFIESVASGIPRLDYFASGGTVGCPALLVEPSAQNLALQSDGLSVSGTWSKSNNTQVTANTTGTTDPAGSTLSDLIFCQATGTLAQGVTQSISIATSGTYTMSVFVKKASNFDWFRIQFQDPAAAVYQVYYNLVSGTLGAVDAGSTGTITNFGNGWYRVTHSRSTASGTISFGLRLANANSALTVPCDGISGAFLWGAQVETGSVATSYIPTTTAAVTRNADVVSVSGAVSGSIGQTEGTLYAEIVAQPYNNASFPAILQVDDGADSQRFAIFINPSGGIRVRFNASGVNTNLDSATPSVLVAGQTYKIAAAFNFNGSQALYINGVFQASLTVTAGPFTATLNRVMLGNRGGIISPFLIRSAALYNTRLTNDQLAALTTP